MICEYLCVWRVGFSTLRSFALSFAVFVSGNSVTMKSNTLEGVRCDSAAAGSTRLSFSWLAGLKSLSVVHDPLFSVCGAVADELQPYWRRRPTNNSTAQSPDVWDTRVYH